MSKGIMSATAVVVLFGHRPVEATGAAGVVFAPASPWKIWMRPAPPGPGTYSALSTPMRLRRHSSESAPPVATAMLGMSPSEWFLGSRSTFGAAMLATAAIESLSWHLLTLGIVYCMRHLPTCTTSGMFAPSGTPVSVNLPSASVTVYAIGRPES